MNIRHHEYPSSRKRDRRYLHSHRRLFYPLRRTANQHSFMRLGSIGDGSAALDDD
jgi:hypothetical protein